MTPDNICLAMIAKSSDEAFLKSMASANEYCSEAVVVVAPNDPLLKFRFDVSDLKFYGKIHWLTQEWLGYGATRNVALAAAEQLKEWILVLDTGDILARDGKLPELSRHEFDAFMIPVQLGACSFYRPHLIRSKPAKPLRYMGRVHEYIPIPPDYVVKWDGLKYISEPGQSSPSALREHIALLQDDYREGIYPGRCLLYLGRTYEMLKEYGLAIESYMQYMQLAKNPDEQSFWAMMGVARSSAGLKMPYECVVGMYERIINLFPRRAEPLKDLAAIRVNQATEHAARAVCMLPPLDATLWVEEAAYGKAL